MSKFKVGDRVKRVKKSPYENMGFAKLGHVGVVTKINFGNSIELDNRGLYNDVDNFVLAPTFPITSGDYIDSREFTREECERFCDLAVECGFGLGEWMNYYGSRNITNLGADRAANRIYWGDTELFFTTNITTQFREFLDKEKGMKKVNAITQAQLEKIMAHVNEGKPLSLVFGDETLNVSVRGWDIHRPTSFLGRTEQPNSLGLTLSNIMIERQPEKRKVTFELTEEQERELRKQLNQ